MQLGNGMGVKGNSDHSDPWLDFDFEFVTNRQGSDIAHGITSNAAKLSKIGRCLWVCHSDDKYATWLGVMHCFARLQNGEWAFVPAEIELAWDIFRR